MAGFPILSEGAGWIALDKPPGLPVVPGRGEGPSVREQLEACGRRVFIVHRLDRDTSGVLLVALDAATHRQLSMAFEAGQVEKRYLALVLGELTAPLDVERALVPARRGRMRVAREGEAGKPSRTRARPIETFANATLVEATPLTGRTHQIRVHLASAGHPLLVDRQYGRPEPVKTDDHETVVLARTPLHASRLRVPGLCEVSSPLPADMEQALALLRQGVLRLH
ncbi:MAG: RluA family pseudouridine synthase [Myxococcota bacterium]